MKDPVLLAGYALSGNLLERLRVKNGAPGVRVKEVPVNGPGSFGRCAPSG
jgi:hypothetical protein